MEQTSIPKVLSGHVAVGDRTERAEITIDATDNVASVAGQLGDDTVEITFPLTVNLTDEIAAIWHTTRENVARLHGVDPNPPEAPVA